MTRMPLLAVLVPALAFAQGAPPDPVAVSTRLLDHLDTGEFAAAEAMFDARMQAALPQAKLQAVWASLPPAGDRGHPRIAEQFGMQVVRTTLQRGVARLSATVAIDPDGQVRALLIAPWRDDTPTPPPPADAAYTERDMPVGDGERALPGTLAMPKSPSAHGVPAVVLVHGSGGQLDRNETIGANRPFLDIARALAAHGIATLRYDKRTLVRPQDFLGKAYTVDDETTNDAVAAVTALRATPGIDPHRIFVLGHSQGGMLAPRIAQRAGAHAVAGLILLAAPARPLLDLLLEQNRYLALLDGSISTHDQANLDALAAEVSRVRDGQPHSGEVLGAPVTYWRDFDRIDPVADARSLHVPMLLLQGGRDIQVVDADWQRWRGAFANDAQASFHHYPALNHLGIAGTGAGTPAEYDQPGHVDAQLLADIASWVDAH